MLYIFQHMPPRRVRLGISSTLGRGGAISSPSTLRGRSGVASSSTTDLHRPIASEQRCKARHDPSPDPIEKSEEDVASQEAIDDDITERRHCQLFHGKGICILSPFAKFVSLTDDKGPPSCEPSLCHDCTTWTYS